MTTSGPTTSSTILPLARAEALPSQPSPRTQRPKRPLFTNPLSTTLVSCATMGLLLLQ
ncbi:hypothetical protein CCMA1212_006894 [Trichoderma ghanense]|uniref:Uncharacterized protein n=1 Tax=Trichoderma ghanense TaxID=65468 RepID=A0ABY2GYI8_9HYPO